MSRVVVIGRTGQLARCLADTAPENADVVFYDRSKADLSTDVNWAVLLNAHKPEIVINAAAYTAVDRAEDEEALARKVNAESTTQLAVACRDFDIPIVHFSTDYAFDGTLGRPYVETDVINPINAYGRSKVAGELGVLGSGATATVFRTSWVHSSYGHNFLKTMVRLAKERGEVRVVADQFGNPTSAHEIAALIWRILPKLLAHAPSTSGLFHLSGRCDIGEKTSWYHFADAIFEAAKTAGLIEAGTVEPIGSEQFPTPAPRPPDTRMNMHRFETVFEDTLPPWRQSLAPIMQSLRKQT